MVLRKLSEELFERVAVIGWNLATAVLNQHVGC